MRTTAGTLDPPLGNTRLQVAKLFAALLATNSADVNKEFAHLDTIEVLLVRVYSLNYQLQFFLVLFIKLHGINDLNNSIEERKKLKYLKPYKLFVFDKYK